MQADHDDDNTNDKNNNENDDDDDDDNVPLKFEQQFCNSRIGRDAPSTSAMVFIQDLKHHRVQ